MIPLSGTGVGTAAESTTTATESAFAETVSFNKASESFFAIGVSLPGAWANNQTGNITINKKNSGFK